MRKTDTDSAHSAARPIAIWIVVSMGFCVSLALLYPGHYSFDSAYQYWQARTGEFSNITPVPMIGLSSYRDNPDLPETWNSSAHQGLVDLAGHLRPTWLFSALPYLLIHLTLLALAWRRPGDPRAALVLAVTSSSLAYAASFVILAPSAELRFMTWPMVSAPLAIVLWFGPMRFGLKS